MPVTSRLTNVAGPQLWLGRWFAGARREGLLASLTPEAWQTLSAVLSFTGKDGERRFTIEHLGAALGVTPDEAQQRFQDLSAVSWNNERLVKPAFDRFGALAGAALAPLESLASVQPDGVALQTAIPPDGKLGRELTAVGLNPTQVVSLVSLYPEERIRRQLDWLPERHAKNPAALLIRAVEQDWEAPREVV